MEETSWWKTVLFGLLFLGLAAYLFWDLSEFEAAGGNRRMHSIIVGLYNIGGKWLASGFFAAVGLGAVVLGIVKRNN